MCSSWEKKSSGRQRISKARVKASFAARLQGGSVGAGMEFRLLGRLEVGESDRAIEIAGSKQRALLAILLLNANRVVSTDRLIDDLWEDEPPETATKALQVHVSQLRKLLGPGRLVTRRPGYLLEVAEGHLDLDRFEGLLREAREAEPATASAQIGRAHV